ncbi:MAG: hypothetical protein WBR17_03305 [Paraburkholderia sp.]
MVSNEDREANAKLWLQRLQEAAAAKESLVNYTRRHGLKPGEAYRWKKELRREGRWPAHSSRAAKANRPKKSATTELPRFARVRIEQKPRPISMASLCLRLHLTNGRRAELVLNDEGQLPRVLELLEQPI